MLALGLAVGVVSAQTPATYKVIEAFNYTNGSDPVGNLVFDGSGNVYGVTAHGGSVAGSFCYNNNGCGTVYELSPNSGGGWKFTLFHTFIGDSANDGALPVSGLLRDAAGNLYGAAPYGGSCPLSIDGCGVVYEISPAAGGGWQAPKILYSFQGSPDGAGPQSTLIFDKAGNLYGTTIAGGSDFGGTVFELSPSSSGEWKETVLYNFNTSNGDGYGPLGGVTFDTAGNLYGTTEVGGAYQTGNCSGGGCGTVYKLSPNGTGGWTESILFSFNGTTGNNPLGNFAVDASGNLYGVTLNGGTNQSCGVYGCGVVYEMARNGSGAWVQRVLRNLPETVGGFYPGPAIDVSGNLYASLYSGTLGQYGIALRLKKSQTAPWPATTLYKFSGAADGGYPTGVALYKGSLFGTTGVGGNTGDCVFVGGSGCGVVFEIQ
jgi:hypothetical protein